MGALFDVLTDHGRYDRFPGVRRAEVVKPGDPPPNGLGALRRVWIGPLRFDEEITAWEPPHAFDYVIRELRGFWVHHHGGRVELSEENGGTRAVWTSEFEIPIPLVGGVLGQLLEARFARGFEDTLERAADLARS